MEAYKQSSTKLKLVIVGDAPTVDDYLESLKRLCDERILMTGYLFGDDYRELSQNARFFVLPSGIDGTRPVLLDQMGFGNCVLVRNTPANMEVISDAGLWFDNDNDISTLREKIDYLSDNPGVVEEYRAKAIQRVAQAYSWEAVTTK